MKKVYAVAKVRGLYEPFAVFESRDEAVYFASKALYLDENESPEDYVFDVPLIPADVPLITASCSA